MNAQGMHSRGRSSNYGRQRFYDLLGQRLYRARTKADMTQQQLADATGASKSVVANAEAGQNAPMHYVFAASRSLGVTVDSLMPEEET